MSEYTDHDLSGPFMGLVEKRFTTFAYPPDLLFLENGQTFGPVTLAYETYGTYDPKCPNAILVLHALSGDSHVAGYYGHADSRPGWWDIMVGPGKGIDTDRYFVICSNVLGGCMGSSGPASPNPATNRPYGLEFPLVTIGDMVVAQRHLLRHLGVSHLLAVIGGSMGGMQVLEWTVRFPDMLDGAIPMATTTKHSALAIAFNEVARQAIMKDPHWNKGDYANGPKPNHGLAVARMIGHITYLSDESLRRKFDRRLQGRVDMSYNFEIDFQVESYLHHQGQKFVERFDANTFLYLTKAADYFNLESSYGNGSLVSAFSRAKARFLVISFTSDWLYPTYQSREMVKALKKNGLDVSFLEIKADCGHDAFLLPNTRLSDLIHSFLDKLSQEASHAE